MPENKVPSLRLTAPHGPSDLGEQAPAAPPSEASQAPPQIRCTPKYPSPNSAELPTRPLNSYVRLTVIWFPLTSTYFY